MKNSSLLGTVCACVFVSSVFTIADAAEPVLTNGSLTGTPVADEVPPGWTIPNIPTATPSTVDENGPFNFTDVPWTLSPDGGTFVRGNGHVDVEFQDAFEQSVSGFTPGESYTLEFFQTNLGFRDLGPGDPPRWDDWLERDGYWGLFVDSILVGQSTTISGPANFDDPILWLSDGITFTASSAAQTLRLQAFTAESEIAYLGIDGLTLTLGGTPTPAPEFDSTPAAGATLAFGSLVVQGESNDLFVQVDNLGDADLTLGCSISGSGSGSFNLNACPTPIAGAGSGNISVSCQPESIGAKTAALEVTTNDADESNVSYNLTCTGIEPPPNDTLFSDGFEDGTLSPECPCWDEIELTSVTAENHDDDLSCDTASSFPLSAQIQNTDFLFPEVEGGFSATDDGANTNCNTRDFGPHNLQITTDEASKCIAQIAARCAAIGHPITNPD